MLRLLFYIRSFEFDSPVCMQMIWAWMDAPRETMAKVGHKYFSYVKKSQTILYKEPTFISSQLSFRK